MLNEIELKDNELKLISDLVYSKFGIVLTEKKRSLVSGRLQKVLREKQFNSFQQYYDLIIKDSSGKELLELVDKLSTNHTYFFREEGHFEFLKKYVFPNFLKQKEIRVWSSASSSGEEVYTIKIVLEEFFRNSITKKLLLGTDISTSVLKLANEGIYPLERIESMSKYYINKYFNKLSDDKFQVKEIYRNEIMFKRLNLMNPAFPFKHEFDIIFCRNVMIYFDEKTKFELMRKFYKHLKKGGFLIIGMSETLGQGNNHFRYIKPSIYQKI